VTIIENVRVLLDTNILLRLLNPVDREYSIVRTAVDILAATANEASPQTDKACRVTAPLAGS
jgi:hypothetical protein